MNKNKGNLHIIGLGGTGVKIAVSISEKAKELDNGFSNFTTRLVDTTTKTIQGYPDYIDNFKHLTSNKANSTLDGAAGERKNKEILKDIIVGMKEYLDISNLPNNKNDYYMLVASGSGGSGGTMLTVLLQLMIERGYNVIVSIVGDSSNLLNLTNTINNIDGLQKTALKTKTAISVVYYNNTIDGQTTMSTEFMINERIYKMSVIISAFISGDLIGIDNQDMINFFRPSLYKTFNVSPGIYSLGITSKTLNDENTLLARTMISGPDEEYKVNTKLMHNKDGVISEEAKDNFERYPMFLLFRKNILNAEIKNLKKELSELEHLSKCDYESFESLDESESDDEFGLIV